MPKKFDGENSKAAAAKARKDAVKAAEKQRKEEAEANEYWRDDDRNAAKKKQRQDDKEKKRQEQLAKKAEAKALAEKEMDSIKVEAKQTASKITRLQIQAEMEKREAAAAKSSVAKAKPTTVTEEEIPENVNRLVVEGEVARTVDEAIKVLSISDKSSDLEKHPEKRMKAAWTAFEEKNLPRLRNENPNMRLSQVKQMLHREWLKSPENPMNAAHARYNEK